ncbi:RTA1 like protein-domain-containing protein [Ilyonectria robusta]|uniref:RTA1 like protein-domain-containing protein n=1 Tax=Ilyonectria robusta TaxID=1079257 RepID=UPI001E8D585E|nr:RTA1 like protein-domain-containing protein [Ilyonectria robusta]KAH8738425.1 RTA1 like protein-domain-containing protein [Ilyonectria robusta]
MAEKKLYQYDPSLAAAIIFLIIFAASAVLHTWQIIRTKNWYFIPFLVGTLAEAIGCIGRAIGAKESPDWTRGPYVIQALLLLLGPTLFAASIYMVLGRLIVLLEAQKHSFIRPSRLTKFFVLGDIISIAAQALGGAKLANADTADARSQGETIIIAGLGVQIIFFGLFIITTVLFHRRINAEPTEKSMTLTVPWRRLLTVLYATSMLILVRSVFRVIEYIMGRDGVLQSKEVFIYIFDILLMSGVAIVFNWFHPSKIMSVPGKERIDGTDSEMQLGGYDAPRRK